MSREENGTSKNHGWGRSSVLIVTLLGGLKRHPVLGEKKKPGRQESNYSPVNLQRKVGRKFRGTMP